MARFVICGSKTPMPYSYYITHNGCITTTGEKAFVLTSLAEAKLELDYWRKNTAGYTWQIEQLPPRVKASKALLRAVPIEA